MISQSNYIQQSSNIQFNALPPVLKDFDKVYRSNFKEANDDPSLTSVISLYYQKLNEYVAKNQVQAPKAENSAAKQKYKYRLRLQLQEEARMALK